MSIVIVRKTIKGKQIDIDAIERSIRKAAEATGKDIVKDYETITKDWNHKPTIELDIEVTGRDLQIFAGTTDKVFGFLDKGTSKRYALMAPGYKAKTRPGRLSSNAGGGRVRYIGKARPVFYSRRKKWPRPGIKARGWTPKLQKRHSAKFVKRVTSATFSSVRFK